MRFSVVLLYIDGVRRSREEILAAQPLVGQLSITDWPQGSSANRPLKMAELKTKNVTMPYGLTQPLFDPIILRMTSTGFLLRGWEFRNKGELIQEWWVRDPGDLPDSRR